MKVVKFISHIVIRSTGTTIATYLEDIKKQWKGTVPYHYVIRADGAVKKLLDEKKSPIDNCIHIAYIGGVDKAGKLKDTRTRAQEDALFDLIIRLTETHSAARTIGYDELTGQAENSPGFNVKKWLANYQPDFETAA